MINGIIGVRFKRNCHPVDLWTLYFTSSINVMEYRWLYGEPDVIQIRRTFNDSIKAREWEHKVLRRLKVIGNDKWLNEGTGKAIPSQFGVKRSNTTKEKMSGYANNRSDEHKRKLKENHKGFDTLTKEQLKNIDEKRHMNPNWWNEEHRAKIAKKNRQKANDPEWRKKQSDITIDYYDRIGRKPRIEKVYPETGYGKRKSEEHRKNISKAKKDVKHPTKECKYCNKVISVANYSRWHGQNCKEKNI